MAETQGLKIRRDARLEIRLPVEFEIAEPDRAQVMFSPTSGSRAAHLVAGWATDASGGGVGLLLTQFVPRLCAGVIRVFAPGSGEEAGLGEPLIEHPVRVRRVVMRDHEPTYAVGVAFIDPDPELRDRVAEVLRQAGAAGEEVGADA